ncbi:carboxypeptidase-like regulatory domain-containing protein [Pontibacter populi]|uniref:Carboxypeptidase-like regulatory domain-containing protein n=1 Tax=Pontibacter populi TaxID=890055 RepID=A0ABV1RNJ1_9BACT
MLSLFKPAVLYAALLACFALTSCEREPGSGPNAEGLNGLVKIYNQYGEVQDPTAVTVTIEQTGKTTKTNTQGEYWLPYLASGTYTLKFTKNGHPTTYVRDIDHVRTKYTSTSAPVASMIEPSSYTATPGAVIVNIDDPLSAYFQIPVQLNKPLPAGKEITVKMYLGKDAAVSASNYVHFISFKTSSQEFNITYPYFASLVINDEMKRGDTVYMVIYTDAVEEASCEGPWNKPDCSNSTTINTSNAVVFSEIIPRLE